MHTMVIMLCLLLVSALRCALADEVILRQGSILEAGKSLTTSDGACRLKLQHDGNLITRRRGPFWPKPGTTDPVPESISWTSGSHGRGGDYVATIQTDGNLQVIRRDTGNDVVFTTHVYPAANDSATHQLVFTDKCALRVQRRSGDEDFDRRIWSNIHEWLDNFSAEEYPGLDNVLAKGEFFTYPGQNYGTVCGTGATFCMDVPFSMLLQHDCNLITSVGHDHGDAAAVVWSAGVAGRLPSASDCYLLVNSHDVALYEGSFDPRLPPDADRPGKYWSVPSSFFDVDSYNPGSYNTYQILINNGGQMYLDWD